MYMIGKNSDYKRFIKNNLYYVDKTLLIEELLTKIDEVVLITRPRRFGKTLNLSMLEYYFDITQNSEYLFNGKKITLENNVLFKKHLNKYPVIFLTLKEIKGSSFDNIYSSFKTKISDLYSKYKYIKDKLDSSEKQLFDKTLEETASLGQYKNSLYKLSEFLHKYYNKKVIILLDEYDSMVNSITNEDLYKEVTDLLRGLIGNAFKGNEYLEKGVLTGILRIAKEDLFSGANNITVRTILDDDFKDKFGFTQEEVSKALECFNLQDKREEVKDWYNGYLFGRTDKVTIYNPFSIANYLQEKALKNYWVNTGDNALIKNLLLNSNDNIKRNLDPLLSGDSIEAVIKENILMINLKNSDYLWSLLLFSGYLKPIEMIYERTYLLALVNKEVISSFIDLIKEYFKETITNSYKILDAIRNEDIPSLGEELGRIMITGVSFNDLINENSYHLLMKGIYYCLDNEYYVLSNGEAGKGRYDLLIEPKDKNKTGYVVEIKHSKDEYKLEQLAKEALTQIKIKKYYTNMQERNIKKIILIGIAFYKKDLAIIHEGII